MDYRQRAKQRFESKVKPPNANGCMLWAAARDGGGYGQFSMHNKSSTAHRAAWLLYRGEIAAGLHVLHKCDVPLCVNPDHLFLGTPLDNAIDREAKGRGGVRPGRRGKAHGKLSLDEGIAALQKWWWAASAEAKRQLAKASGTSYFHLSNLTTVEGKTIGPELAGRIETALGGELKRGDLCETCRACVYFKGEK